MNVFNKLAHITICALLCLSLPSCGGGGGGVGGASAPATDGGFNDPPPGTVGPSSPTIVTGAVVDGFIAGATVKAYRVNADGTKGTQIGSTATTGQYGDYSLNLDAYTGPVYLESRGGTYVDTATGDLIDLATSSLTISAIVPHAFGNVTAQMNPLTTMAASVSLTLVAQGIPVKTSATAANAVIANYFGLSNADILFTPLLDLTQPGCSSGAGTQSVDASMLIAGISQLAMDYQVSTPDLIAALVQDVASDGLFDGHSASGAAISVPLLSGTGVKALSEIEGPPPALTGLGSAINAFIISAANGCAAPVSQNVISALSYTNIFKTPPAPAGVKATPAYGAAIISWNTVTTATSYTVSMATSSAVTTTSPGYRTFPSVTSPFAISTEMTSSTYYFVVTAVSGTSPYTGFESAQSAIAQAAVTTNTLPPEWAQSVTAGGSSAFNSVSTAPDGFAYTGGYITGTGTYNFGNNQTASGAFSGINSTLVKYNSSGIAQWARSVVGGANLADSQFNNVSAAPDGSAVYAAGYITGTGTYNFGNNVTATGAFRGTFFSTNLVLVKYDSAGVAQWARTVAGANSHSFFSSVTVATDGSVYAAGHIGPGTYNFGNNITIAGLNSFFNVVLVKYNSAGIAQWARTAVAGNSDSHFYSVTAASDGSVYSAGYIAGSGIYNFGTISAPVTASGSNSRDYNTLLVKYDSSGAAQWARSVTAGPDESRFRSVAASPDGSAVYAAGYITGNSTYSFGNNISAAGTFTDDNMVLVKYSSAGVAQWARSVTAGSSYSRFKNLSVASDGSLYAAGHIAGTGIIYTFGSGVNAVGMSGSDNLVLVKYNSSGAAQWAQTVMAGGAGSQFSGVSPAPDGTVYAAGSILGTDTYDLGNDVFGRGTYSSSTNMVLVKYGCLGSILVDW